MLVYCNWIFLKFWLNTNHNYGTFDIICMLYLSFFLKKVRLRRRQTQALLQMVESSNAEFGVKKAIQKILRAANSVLEVCL